MNIYGDGELVAMLVNQQDGSSNDIGIKLTMVIIFITRGAV
jgi:hypothetical protein